MASPAQSPSVDEIINRVNVEVERRRRQPPVVPTEAGGSAFADPDVASVWPPAAAARQALPAKKKYALDEFLPARRRDVRPRRLSGIAAS